MSYYHGLISSRTASIRLERASKDGCFLIRDSQSQPGNFVLSVRYRRNVYHILIFNEGGVYFLDSSENGKKKVDTFSSLEELVLFGMSHELRVAEEEVLLYEPVLCAGSSPSTSPVTGQRKKLGLSEDCDLLTDMFGSVFGAHCSVLVMVHSGLQFDGRPLEERHCYLGCVVKDNLQRGFYIRVVDPQLKQMVGEKKITKNFEYDLPSELVLTFLSEHGITCLGFRNIEERNMFIRHVDRIVQMQQERKVKLHKHSSSSPEREVPDPTELRHHLKAEEFDIHNLSPEWQYIFEQAGVTADHLKDRKLLQFLLDKIYELGGAPKKLQNKQKYNSHKEERTVAIQMDAALRQESLRASRLADELRKQSNGQVPQPLPRKFVPPSCSYSSVCMRYKELLMQRSSLTGLSPIKIHCYCSICAAGKPLVAVSGSPPHQYTLPVGWTQFILRSQTHSLGQQFCSNWHVAFCAVPASYAATVVRTGRLMHSASDGTVTLSPDIKWAKTNGSITPELYHDEVERKDFKISTVFQVFVQPGSYKNERQDLSSLQPLQQLWQAPERTYIPYALLLQLHPVLSSSK